MVIVLIILWLLLILYLVFEPNIDIMPYKDKYRVYLWYNDITSKGRYRKFIKLFEYEGK